MVKGEPKFSSSISNSLGPKNYSSYPRYFEFIAISKAIHIFSRSLKISLMKVGVYILVCFRNLPNFGNRMLPKTESMIFKKPEFWKSETFLKCSIYLKSYM